MNKQPFDLLDHLNLFFAADDIDSDSQHLEGLLSVVEAEAQSMHDFLEALVNTSLWQGWHIEPNPYKPMIVAIGSEIDRLATLHNEPAFHSRKHMMDVCLMLSYLLRQEDIKGNETIRSPWAT